ncbi:hypothetical protein B9G98_02908 [Wickerhamiella sorbophila]|uniref:Uncharacterized protein n=1 Tax=Wickerhamiella sorbophila TaxID=45607 RepID=A0A2T0FJY4_9ASCO|nr:hypothetical protein B9G98_02908 [Wickerhamiella sorbophila]PRT55288.1 hypothetical protein B9G98_02908 [Wickerhamiella sorbophila]
MCSAESEEVEKDLDTFLLGCRHIPSKVANCSNFKAGCQARLKRKDVGAIKTALTLASNLCNPVCRELVRELLKSPDMNGLLFNKDDRVLDLSIVLARQLPTALVSRKHIIQADVYARYRKPQPDKSRLLLYYLQFTDDRDMEEEILRFRSKALGLGLRSLALLPKSAITDPDQLDIHLAKANNLMLEKLAISLDVSIQDLSFRYAQIKLDPVSGFSKQHISNTGVFLSVEDYIDTQNRSWVDGTYSAASKQVARMNVKLETGTYRYGAPATFKAVEFVIPSIESTESKLVIYEVSIDPDDLSDGGKLEFSRLAPGDGVFLVDKSSIWFAQIVSVEPFIVRSIEKKAESIMIPDNRRLWRSKISVKQDWPEFLIKPLLGWRYDPESASTCLEFVQKNNLAVVAIPPGGDFPLLDWDQFDRTLLVSSRPQHADFKGNVYRGQRMLPRLDELLKKVGDLAAENNMSAFFKNDCPSAQLIGRRLNLLENELFTEIAWLSPLKVLDEIQHENYLLKTADVVVWPKPIHGHFKTIVIDRAHMWSELETAHVINDVLEKLVLIGEASPIPSLFSRMVLYGVHFCEGPLDVSPSVAELYRDWYPTLTPTGDDNLPGFASAVQRVHVDGYGTIAYNEQHVGTAEYAVLLYQYLSLLGYPREKITLIAETSGQKDLINEISLARGCGDAPFSGPPRIFSSASDAQIDAGDVIVYASVWSDQGPDEISAVYGKKGAFFLIPHDTPTSLQVVVGELYDRIVENRAPTPLVGLRHLADYVQEMKRRRLTWLSGK